MAPAPDTVTPRRPASTRIRVSAIPKSASAAPRAEKSTPIHISSEPPRKKRKYIPGGPGGGGRYVDDEGNEIPVGGTGPGGYNYIGPRGRIGRENAARGVVPPVYNRRDRTERTRTVAPRSQQPPMRFSSAAQAAAVVQSDGYKPREERAWEEFHPEMDIEASLRAFSSYELDGIPESRPVTPTGPQSNDTSANGLHTPNGVEGPKSDGVPTPTGSLNGDNSLSAISIPGTPGVKRRPGRPPKDPVAFFTARAAKLGKAVVVGNTVTTPKVPKILPPIQNINAKERLTLPQPSYRTSNTLVRFDEKEFQEFVDKSMEHVGYQKTDIFERPKHLIKVSDANLEEDFDLGIAHKSEVATVPTIGSSAVGRVEYDMDEQDYQWLIEYNSQRKLLSQGRITRELFEITITKIEKEWHLLEKRIPKPNPKPPQTHRPRSSSAAAVNGEPQAGEEQDSKCAICDDGDCENTNAIVFCDGCDLAVHQECYGVPFIPEGQWLCRKCQLIGRGVPTCIFCPNTDGAFKQTNASKWAHLLCAMWIPEVSLGNHTFMEPVMDVEKVPKTRWKLTCYLCNQRMGACIQCGNKSCYQAFHVTCARKAHLFLKMKNSHGTLAVLDGNTVLKAFCDKHCPPDYTKENEVAHATREAKQFYKRTMRGRLWADSQASATAMAATHRHAITEHQPEQSQLTGASAALTLAGARKKGSQPQKAVWKLPSGAPVIPRHVFDIVKKSLSRFDIRELEKYTMDACRYWTLKREARRGAALLKRLQLQMETFSSMEITRRNFAGMGHAGRSRLARRIEFAQSLIEDLEKLKALSVEVRAREEEKLGLAKDEAIVVETLYLPLTKFFPPIIDRAEVLDDNKRSFTEGLKNIKQRVDERFYTTTLPFVHDLSIIFRSGIFTEPPPRVETAITRELEKNDPSRKPAVDWKERKKIAKRIIKDVKPQLEAAARAEADITSRPADELLKEMERILESTFEPIEFVSLGDPASVNGLDAENEHDVEMLDVNHPEPNDVDFNGVNGDNASNTGSELTAPPESIGVLESVDVDMEDADAPGEEVDENDEIYGESTTISGSGASVLHHASESKTNHINGIKSTDTPPDTNGYVAAPVKVQPTPPTPPVSNGGSSGSSVDAVEALNQGGVLWHMKDFAPEGTSVTTTLDQILSLSEDIGTADGIDPGADGVSEQGLGTISVSSSPSKSKKGKATKKKAARRR